MYFVQLSVLLGIHVINLYHTCFYIFMYFKRLSLIISKSTLTLMLALITLLLCIYLDFITVQIVILFVCAWPNIYRNKLNGSTN